MKKFRDPRLNRMAGYAIMFSGFGVLAFAAAHPGENGAVTFNQKPYLILDVRDREAYEEGHIEDAVNIEYDSLVEKADEVLEDRGITVYVYGEDAAQSCAAAQKLTDIGYNSVAQIGSYRDWTAVETETETEGILTDVLE